MHNIEPTIIRTLRDLGNAANEQIDYLNHGGCCVYAAQVATRLELLGYEAAGLVADFDTWTDLDGARNERPRRPRTPYQWNERGVGFNHVVVQVVVGGQAWTHDSNNTVQGRVANDPTFGAPIIEGSLTTEELRALAGTPRGWNRCFYRRTGIPAIRRLVNEFLPLPRLTVEATSVAA